MTPQPNPVLLNVSVFPSDERTISVTPDVDYGGAHRYTFRNCLGFADGQTVYVDDANASGLDAMEAFQTIQFVQKDNNGVVTPGLQSEQIVLALIDRQEKLNARFPSDQNEKALLGLRMFLDAQKERVMDRMGRGVMGNLKT